MTKTNHHAIVESQFNPRADAYLNSAVHAGGEDLEQMIRLIGTRPEAMALDVGCGGGHVTFQLAQLVGTVVAYDLSPLMLDAVIKESGRRGLVNVVTELGAVEFLPFPSESFDLAVTRYSMHHWQDVPAGLAQMRRVLKPGGLGMFMDVITPGVPLLDTWLQSLELLRDPSHVRNASLVEWGTLLTTAGFMVCSVTKFRLRLDFSSWIERMSTPECHVLAIRSLQQRMGSEVAEYFDIEADGSFTVDTVLITAEATAVSRNNSRGSVQKV